MRGAGGGGADAAGVGALTPSMKVYVAPFIQLLQYSTTYCILYCIYTVLYCILNEIVLYKKEEEEEILLNVLYVYTVQYSIQYSKWRYSTVQY